MFQPNSLRALRDLKLDKELEKNAQQFQLEQRQLQQLQQHQTSAGRPQTEEQSERNKLPKNRSMSGTQQQFNPVGTGLGKDKNINQNDSSDISEDEEDKNGNGEIYDDPEGEEDLPSNGNAISDQAQLSTKGSSGTMANSSEYYSKMKQLLEKNPYHPMNFIFDHKDLLEELNTFIQETRDWRDTQQKELQTQLENNKQRAVDSIEMNEEIQRKIREQAEFEAYLENVKQVQEDYNKDVKHYQQYINKQGMKNNTSDGLDDKENRKNNGNVDGDNISSYSQQSTVDQQALQAQLARSKEKIMKLNNIEDYLEMAEMEVEYNKHLHLAEDTAEQLKFTEDIKNLDEKEDKLIEGICQWENEIDALLLGLNNEKQQLNQPLMESNNGVLQNISSLSSKQRIQSARVALRAETPNMNGFKEQLSSKDAQIEKELEELDQEFDELEKMLESAANQ